MLKRVALATLLVLALSTFAFAGEGSDTIGACKMLPQLRYGYSVSNWETDSAIAFPYTDWDISAHNYYAQLNWGVHPNIDIYALVGGRSVCAESEFDVLTVKTDSVPMFLWGFGVKGTFYRADSGFYVGAGLLFTHSFSDDFSLKTYVNGVLVSETDEIFSRYVIKVTPDIHVGWNFKNIGLTPYLGVDYTWGRAITKFEIAPGFSEEIQHDLEHPFGIYGGIDYYLNDKLYINVEGRSNFVNGWGVETGIGYKFDICGAPAPAPEPIPAPVIEPKLEPMSQN